ncbi:MAG TPA: PH domain-containing protein [Phycisphaerae bacterium]|nr:PH domain-containing protein [Phycisphaerae bacterium]
MNCPRCNAVIDADSKFCKLCGATAEAGGAGATSAEVLQAATSKAGPGERGPDIYRDPKFEKQVWEGRPAWRSYWGLWVLWAAISLICIIATYRWSNNDSVRWAILLLAAGAAVAIFIREALQVLSLRYRLTTQRLFIHKGIITRVTDQLELVRVDDVRLRQGIIDRIVNTGDVEVIGTDNTDPDITLESIQAPAEVAEALRAHVRGVRSKGTLFVENV